MSQEFSLQTTDELVCCAVTAVQTVFDIFCEGYGLAHGDIKDDGSVITEYDSTIEDEIIAHLTSEYPESTIIAEESDFAEGNSDELVWIIDPIDGTINYELGSLPSAIGVGIEKNGEIYGGVIGMPLENNIYYAVKGEGAYCNDKQITVRDGDDKEQFVVGAELRPENQAIDGYMDMVSQVSEEMQTIRCVRSGLADACHIASGRLHAAFNVETSPWDVAPATIIVREAGGTVTSLTGSEEWSDIRDGEAVYSTGEYHQYLLQFFN